MGADTSLCSGEDRQKTLVANVLSDMADLEPLFNYSSTIPL